MIDIDQHRIEATARQRADRNLRRIRHRKEVAMDETTARIAGELFAQRQQALRVPFDHLGQRVDHDQ